jgi:acyl-CoA synthetase (AMP-forming)/AMP-acid ligase II
MANPKMTHIIFIDNDISWDPQDILKLIISDKNIVGGIYPLKNYNWSQLLADKKNPTNPNVIGEWIKRKNASQFKDIISDESMIQYNLVRYNVNYLNNTLNIEKNLAKVKHIATGFMMIKRSVIEKMSKAFPSTKYVDDVNFLRPEENEFAYALFDCGVEEGHYFSEDWLFCHRWTKMGGSIWMDVSISLTHTGIEDYRGCYITSVLN